MVYLPGIKAAVELVIQRNRRHFFIGAGVTAIKLGFIQPARRIHLIQLNVGMQIAQLLPHRPTAIKHMLNVVAHHVFTAIVFVVIILAFVKGVGDLLPVMRNHGAVIRQTGVASAFRVTVQIGHQIQTRLVGDTPGQAGHQRVTLFLQWTKLRVRVTRHPAQSRRHAIVIIQCPGDVKRRAALVIVAGKQLHFAARIKRWLT